MGTQHVKSNLRSIVSLLTFICIGMTLFSIDSYASKAFKHVTSNSNTSSHITTINHSATNNNPNALLIVTHDYGSSGPYQKKAVGVWYSGGKWKIYNEDRSAMLKGVKFNVLVTSPSSYSFSHTAASGNITNNYTILNHPALNNNPNALLLVTQNWKGTYNTNAIGVWYTGSRWSIYNQNRKAMPKGTRFNVFIANKSPHGSAFLHNAGTSSNHISYINSTKTNSKSSSYVFTTQNWKTSGPYNDHQVGVWYASNKWTVYNEDRAKLPKNAKFNMFVMGGRVIAIPTTIKKVYKGNDGGYYYVRKVGNVVYWFGEKPNGAFANVFKGTLSGNTITGTWQDVPKGNTKNKGTLKLKVTNGGNKLSRISQTGGFSGSQWTATPLPSNLPKVRTKAPWQGNTMSNLSGIWTCNDGGIYYIIDYNSNVVWFGERKFNSGKPGFANVMIGKCSSTSVTGKWADVPKGTTNNSGNIVLKMTGAHTLTKTSQTGGFSGSKWSRIDGTWKNKDANTNSIPKLIIDQYGARVHVYGKCHPTNCDWKKTGLTPASNKHTYIAKYDQGFVKRVLKFTLQANGDLKLVMTSDYTDSRPTKTATHYFKK